MRPLGVGDEVLIVHRGYLLGSDYIGSTGTLVKIDHEDALRPYLIEFGSGIKQWVEAKCVKPIENHYASTSKRKVGDIVRVKSREWYEANKDADGDVMMEGVAFTPSMTDFCSRGFKIAQVVGCDPVRYRLYGAGSWYFTEGMLEEGYLRVDGDTMSGNFIATAVQKIKGVFEKDAPNISVPLIRQNQLLTNIKLD